MRKHRSSKRISPPAKVSGTALWSALGFKNVRAFQRAKAAGLIDVPLYPMPGQSRGWFARTDELASYLTERRGDVGTAEVSVDKHPKNDTPDDQAHEEGGRMT